MPPPNCTTLQCTLRGVVTAWHSSLAVWQCKISAARSAKERSTRSPIARPPNNTPGICRIGHSAVLVLPCDPGSRFIVKVAQCSDSGNSWVRSGSGVTCAPGLEGDAASQHRCHLGRIEHNSYNSKLSVLPAGQWVRRVSAVTKEALSAELALKCHLVRRSPMVLC